MTVTYHAGRRIQGLDADRTATQLPAGEVGGWVELGRTTLGANGDNITVSSLPNKRYYMILRSVQGTTAGGAQSVSRFGSGSIDTGSNYATRYNDNGGTDGTYTSGSFMLDGYDGNPELGVHYIANYSTKEKLMTGNLVSQNTAGAGAVPNRRQQASKWTNTSNPIDIINLFNNGGADFASGSELVVLGYDPADTHSSNFWEELASVNATGSSTNLSSGTITAKKYLWIQIWLDPSTRQNHLLRFNNDTGNNYATRYSTNGATDSTDGSVTNFNLGSGIGTSDGLPSFQNIFVINNSSNEKLAIIHSVWQNTAGAGNATGRIEMVGKWANTASQITEIDIDSSANWNSGSIMKVWGAD